jgi:hypothetical protein
LSTTIPLTLVCAKVTLESKINKQVINLYFISQKKTSPNDFDEVSNIAILDL